MKKIFYVLFALSFLAIFYLYMILSIESNTVLLPNPLKSNFKTVSPQGWGFFTRSPKEDNLRIYLLQNNKAETFVYSNGSYKNWGGISRKSRTLGLEISILMNKVKGQKWHKVSANDKLLHMSLNKVNVTSDYLFYLKKGEYLLVKKPIIPWAWYGYKNNFIPYETLRVQID